MTPKLLYYASLEKHMDSYMDQVKQTELNEQFQLAQNKTIREGELMNLSQADVMNKLKQLQEDLKNQVAQSIIVPLSKTNAPEMIVPKEEYKPMTSNEYESIINKKPTIKVENRRGLIDELKEKLQKRKKTQMISEVFPAVNKQEVNKLLDSVLSDLINQGLKKQDVMKGAEKVVDNLLKQASNQSGTNRINITLPDILDKKSNLKAVKKTVKTKSKTPFQQELEAKINIRNVKKKLPFMNAKMKDEFQADLRDRELTKIAKKSIIPTSTSTQATTASTTSDTSNINTLLDSKAHISHKTQALRAEFEKRGKTWPYGKGNVSYANMVKAREQLGQGLKKKVKK